jgi:hypothetical protein
MHLTRLFCPFTVMLVLATMELVAHDMHPYGIACLWDARLRDTRLWDARLRDTRLWDTRLRDARLDAYRRDARP